MDHFYRRHLPHWQPLGRILFVTFRLHGSLPEAVLDRIRQERDRLRKIPSRPSESPHDRALREGKRLYSLLDQALAGEIQNPHSQMPKWLARDDIAALVRQSMQSFEGIRYREHRFVIMPNHVHWPIEPLRLTAAVDPSIRGEKPGENPAEKSTEMGVRLAPNWPTPANARNEDQPTDLEVRPTSQRLPGIEQEPREFWPIRVIMKSLKGYTARMANRVLLRSGPFWQEESFDHWIRNEPGYHRVINYIDHNPVAARLAALPENWRWSSAGESALIGLKPIHPDP